MDLIQKVQEQELDCCLRTLVKQALPRLLIRMGRKPLAWPRRGRSCLSPRLSP